jgi:hypothetical protein
MPVVPKTDELPPKRPDELPPKPEKPPFKPT